MYGGLERPGASHVRPCGGVARTCDAVSDLKAKPACLGRCGVSPCVRGSCGRAHSVLSRSAALSDNVERVR